MKKFSIVTLTFLAALVSIGTHAEESVWDWLLSFKRFKEVAPVINSTYKEECGSCHLAYPPGLLPSASWQKLLNKKALADHFGDSAELDEETRKELELYALDNAAEKSYYKRPRKIMASLGTDEAPLRITEIPYIREKHEDIPSEKIKGNKKVGSLSQCDKCHRQAQNASFDDDTVLIP
ncbi:MAG: diheme cytochrome c [Gammaproteobacteria bacterium]|nr:diheme cytochrome c [Gammaproteobacteria bacterium]